MHNFFDITLRKLPIFITQRPFVILYKTRFIPIEIIDFYIGRKYVSTIMLISTHQRFSKYAVRLLSGHVSKMMSSTIYTSRFYKLPPSRSRVILFTDTWNANLHSVLSSLSVQLTIDVVIWRTTILTFILTKKNLL